LQRIGLKREPSLSVKYEAFPYQFEAVKAIRDLEYAAVFYEMGLGKSKIAIDLMLYWLEKGVVDTILYVAKKSLLYNCEKEFGLHTFIKPKLLTQNRNSNFFVFNAPSRLVLTNYEVLTSEFERLKLFLQARNVAVVLDESAKIKNPDSSITEAAFALGPLFRKRVIMTGTPVANRPYDLWAQIFFLDQGESLGCDFGEFKRKADLAVDLYQDVGAQQRLENFLDDLFSRISHFTIRKTKNSGVLQLPEKEIRTVYVDCERQQYDLYCQFKDELRAVVVKEGIPVEDNADQVLKRLLRLVQIASNPHLVDQSYRQNPGKFDVLNDLVSSISTKDEKCIVWTSFVENVDWLCEELRRFGTCKIHGKMDMDRRNKAVDSFLSDPDVRVLVATPSAAKEGLTLTVANHVIYFDRSFSLDDYLQSQDRIHRISQTRRCYVYKLILKDSIDEWVDLLLEAKHLAAQLAQGDISLDYYRSQMSYDFGEMVRQILGIAGGSSQP